MFRRCCADEKHNHFSLPQHPQHTPKKHPYVAGIKPPLKNPPGSERPSGADLGRRGLLTAAACAALRSTLRSATADRSASISQKGKNKQKNGFCRRNRLA